VAPIYEGDRSVCKVITSTRPRKAHPDVEARGTLFCGTDRLGDLFAGCAILTIARGDDDRADYWLEAVPDRLTGRIAALDLRRFGSGETYRISIDGDNFHCDCPDSVYRGRRCKHLAAVSDALTKAQE
jgi:hypothetical protein